ncbi:MAG: hypothetical protein LCH96_01630 [Actinobacteria bacterium]|nr:hypothetical protein [Actinomycetota bacterium]
MRHVAFFRNLNLGQARSKSPTSAVLVSAFLTSGARLATSFQTNGTVVFEADDPAAVVVGARGVLAGATGYADVAVVRDAGWVVELGGRLDPGLVNGEVALFDAASAPALEVPWLDPSGSLTVVEIDALHAVTSWADPRTGSSANPTLTRLLGVPVTCRGVPTMIRLAARLAS